MSRKFAAAGLTVILLLALQTAAQTRKYGVFIGIGAYPDDALRLTTSAADATRMRDRMVADFGFARRDTRLLLDAEATRRKILAQIEEVIALVRPGDLFVLYYSGHGARFPDLKSEEIDEKPNARAELYDTALVPVDFTSNESRKQWRNLIIDDELYALFAQLTAKSVGVVFVSDSCYASGQQKTVYDASALGKSKALNLLTAFGLKDWNALAVDAARQRKVVRSVAETKGRYLGIFSSKDVETSFSGSAETGNLSLFTHFFLQTLDEYKRLKRVPTYRAVFKETEQKVSDFAMDSGSAQTPSLLVDLFRGNLDAPLFSFETFPKN